MTTISQALAMAIQHHQAGRLHDAERIYRQILAVGPDCAQAWHLLGVIAIQAGRHEVAVEHIRRAIALDETQAEFHCNLGGAHAALRELPEAIAAYRRALQLKPDFAEAQNNLGNALRDLGDKEEALLCYRRAAKLKPDYAMTHNNLGNALENRGDLDEAIACYRRALRALPRFAAIHNNLGNALKNQGQLDEAAACCRRALELQPDLAGAHFNYSSLLLLAGDFRRGWDEFEWRWTNDPRRRRGFLQPLWDGRPLEGKTILLHAEQGLGDTIQFIRYARLVQRAGGRVLVECQRSLLPLLKGCRGVDGLVAQGKEPPHFSVHFPLLSLPRLFQTDVTSIPADVPYLFAEPGLVDRWRQELEAIPGFKIGIAWQGSPAYHSDYLRSIPLGCFEPLSRYPGVRLLSLQKGPGLVQLQGIAGRFPVADWGSRLDEASGPFLDTAAVMMGLDLVVTSDTAIAHLAGALGVPVWVALPFVPDWRWLLGRDDSPWYPTMRLFRQQRPGDWASAFAEMEIALAARVASGDTSA